MLRLVPVELLFVAVCFQSIALAQSPAGLVTTRAELEKSVNFGTLKQGDSFFLKTATDWQTDNCTIRANTTITGETTTVELNKSGPRKIVLAVRFAPVSCSEQEGREMLPVLVAMQGAPPPENDGLKRMGTAAFEGQQIQNLFSNPVSAAAAGVKLDRQTNNSQNSGTTFNASGFIGAADKQLKTGEVRGLRGIKMELPQNGTATMLIGSHDIALERHTQFVLLFTLRLGVSHEVAWGLNPIGSPASRNRVDEAVKMRAPEPEETEVCAASGCTQLAAERGQISGSAAWTLPLAGLGFTPRLNNALYALDEDTSVHFLGEDELLFTFNLHTLVRRSAEQAGRGWRPRHIRAVVLSRSDGRVLRMEDWTVSNAAGPYVWSLGGGRILAQVGGELVTYGAGLVTQQHYVLHGPLLFVSASPGAELMLVATLHEKHTKEEHEKLAAFLGPDRLVDEDYDLTGLNENLQLIGERRMSAEPLQPALLQSAMVRAKPDHGDRWEIQEDSWSGQRKVLSRLASGCEMEVKSLPGNLLFTHGCVPAHGEASWYRVLDLKGATVLKGKPEPFELLQQAETDETGKLFAIASTQFNRRVALDGSVRASDFPPLSVSVYSTFNGKQIFAAHPAAGSHLRNTFALSPSGTSLAVLTEGALHFYILTPEPSAQHLPASGSH